MRPSNLFLVLFFLGASLAISAAAIASWFWYYWVAYVIISLFLLFLDAILAPRLNRLKVECRLPEQLYLGHPYRAHLLIESSVHLDSHASLKIDVCDLLCPISVQNRVALVSPQTTIPFELQAQRRGLATIEAVWIKCLGPLGLVQTVQCYPLGIQREVTPNLDAVSKQAVRLFTTKNFQAGIRVERFLGDGSEFEHLREYIPGFDVRTIDWKASARHAKLLCRELRPERNRQVILALDSGRLMSEPLQGVTRLDYAIQAALVLGYISLRVGDRVGLVSFDQNLKHFLSPLQGQSAFGSISRLASRIHCSSAETNFTLSLMELSKRLTRRALIVIMTEFVDSITAELMVENLSRLCDRHLILFVALQDPLLNDEILHRPDNWLKLQQGLVAQRLLQEREVVIRKLRRLGVLCVDALPKQATAQLIDRYLEVKRKEAF